MIRDWACICDEPHIMPVGTTTKLGGRRSGHRCGDRTGARQAAAPTNRWMFDEQAGRTRRPPVWAGAG